MYSFFTSCKPTRQEEIQHKPKWYVQQMSRRLVFHLCHFTAGMSESQILHIPLSPALEKIFSVLKFTPLCYCYSCCCPSSFSCFLSSDHVIKVLKWAKFHITSASGLRLQPTKMSDTLTLSNRGAKISALRGAFDLVFGTRCARKSPSKDFLCILPPETQHRLCVSLM